MGRGMCEDVVASGSSAAAAGGRLLSFHDKRMVLGLEEERSKTQSLSGSKRREQMRDSLITHSLHSLFIIILR